MIPRIDIFLNLYNILGFLEQQINLVGNINLKNDWKKHIYANLSKLSASVQESDCLAECAFIEIRTCQFFVLKDFICYLGRYDYYNGTALDNVDVQQISIIQRK